MVVSAADDDLILSVVVEINDERTSSDASLRSKFPDESSLVVKTVKDACFGAEEDVVLFIVEKRSDCWRGVDAIDCFLVEKHCVDSAEFLIDVVTPFFFAVLFEGDKTSFCSGDDDMVVSGGEFCDERGCDKGCFRIVGPCFDESTGSFSDESPHCLCEESHKKFPVRTI